LRRIFHALKATLSSLLILRQDPARYSPATMGDLHRLGLGRIAQDQVPVDQTGERFVEASVTLEKTRPVREGRHGNEVAFEKALAIEGDAAHEGLRRIGRRDQQRGVYGVAARLLLECASDGSQKLRIPHVVRVEVCNDVATALRERAVPRRGGAPVLLKEEPNAGIGEKTADDVGRAVGAPVVHDEEFPPIVALPEHALDRRENLLPAVPNREHHRDEWTRCARRRDGRCGMVPCEPPKEVTVPRELTTSRLKRPLDLGEPLPERDRLRP
jgi:hypothetical protein